MCIQILMSELKVDLSDDGSNFCLSLQWLMPVLSDYFPQFRETRKGRNPERQRQNCFHL